MSSRFKLSKPILEATIANTANTANTATTTVVPETIAVKKVVEHIDQDDQEDQEDVVAPVTTVNRISNEEQFWNYAEGMSWRDRSDEPNFNLALKKERFKTISIADQEAFADFLTHCVNTLNETLDSKGFYGNLEDIVERKAICSHIVGRGSIFYALTMEDPGFAMYLVPEDLSKKEYFDMMELIRI